MANLNSFCKMLIVCLASYSTQYLHAASYTWSGGTDLLWSTTANWGGVAPTTGDTATIGNSTTSRTILYDSSASGNLGTLLLSQSTTGVTNTLRFIKSGTTTISNDISLGSGDSTAVSQIYVDSSLNQSTAAGAAVTLKINSSGTGTITLNTGGALVINGYYHSTTGYVATVTGNVDIKGGSLTATTTTSATAPDGSVSNKISGSLSMSSGTISISDSIITTKVLGNRLEITGSFDLSGGSLYIGKYSTLTLTGASNKLYSELTYGGDAAANYGQISLFGNVNQTFETDQYIPNLMVRGGGSYVRKITSTYSGSSATSFGVINFGQGNAGATTTLQLGSNISANSISAANGNTGGIKFAIDLNSYNFSLLNSAGTAQTWTPMSVNNTTPVSWYITNSGGASTSGVGTFIADSFNFSTAFVSGTSSGPSQVNVGYDSDGSSSDAVVILKAVGTGANNLSGGGTINPTSKFWYANPTTGQSATLTSTRTMGKLEVGENNAVTLRIVTNNLTVAGDVKLNSASTLDLGGKVLTLTGSANLTGNGGYSSTNTGASIVFAAGSTGGLSPGGSINVDDSGRNSVGEMYMVNAGNFSATGVQLASTSTSWFDIAGDNTSTYNYDILNLAGVNITYDGNLFINVISGTYDIGHTWEIVTNEGSIAGAFSSITSSNGWTFDFDESNGQLTLLAIPEPSTVGLLGVSGVLLLVCTLRRKYRTVAS